MVQTLSIIFMAITLIVCVVLPIIVAFVFKKKKISTLKVFFIGMIGFFLSQFILRAPILYVIATQNWYVSLASNVLLISLFLGLTAGLFETFGRLFVFKILLKRSRTYGDGLMAGLGHGTIEAILIVGLAFVSNIVMIAMINTGATQAILDGASANPAVLEQTRQAIETLISTPSSHFLVAGLERILTIIIHMGLSLLVLEGIKRQKTAIYMVYAILIHALLDFFAVFLVMKGIDVLLIEGLVFVFAAISLKYIITAKKRFQRIESKEIPETVLTES